MASRITYPAKSNNPSDPDAIRKFFFNEADEIKSVANAHADDIESILNQLISSLNPFYGHFASLALLIAAHPTGELNAWAIIDPGVGVTPQIAFWDNVGSSWQISGATDVIIYVANAAALPAPGITQKLYVTNDKGNIYLWIGAAYLLVGGAEYATIAQINAAKPTLEPPFIATTGQTVFTLTNQPVTVDVYVDRIYQLDTIDYTLVAKDVTLTDAPGAGSIVVIRKYF